MSSTSYSLFNTWSRTSEHLFNSVLAANRAAAAAFGVPMSDPGNASEARITAGSDLEEWDVERSTRTRGDLSVGDRIEFAKTITERDVEQFAAVSGDTNPIHLDENYADDTRFGGRIVHGMLVTGLISAALARLPGNVIYLSQDVQFLKPVRIGDRVTAEVEIAEDFDDERFRLVTRVLDADGDLVVDGEAVVLIDDAPALD
ncbi:MaoC family dehydratase [Halomarina halobia]|uniref:MaoC family dehydratase n=1 Tax=Halomarina halobia TaxID=3033386 RepID=A0ABD6AB53_9EURY|nr:MaoC family dehydratase [Halomarina sp. PSR21]